MKIFFKLKNIENLEYDDQIKIIKKYIAKYCKFQEDEVLTIRFVRHTQQKNVSNINEYALGCYFMSEKVSSDAINTRLENPTLYEYFDVFTLI